MNKYLQISICIALLFFSAAVSAEEPPCQNVNQENYCGVLKHDYILNGYTNLVNGNFTRSWQDMYIPGRGLSLEVKRTYNTQIGTAIKSWYPESGTWNIENNEYSGEGDRTVLGARIKGDFRVNLKMKTVQKGENFPYEVGWVNVCYTDKDNRYTFLINTNGDLELVRYKNGIATGRVRKSSGINPLEWNNVRIEKSKASNGVTVVYAAVNEMAAVWLADQDPLPDAFLCLEAYFCHAHFDDVSVSTDGTITYETPQGPVFSQRPVDNPFTDVGDVESKQLSYDFTFTTVDERSIFGYGWTWNFGIKLQRGPNDVLIVEYPDRHVDAYTKNTDGTYSPPKGVYHTLTASINESDHSQDKFTLKEKYGAVYNFDAYGRISSIVDRNSNQLTFTYNDDISGWVEPPRTKKGRQAGWIMKRYDNDLFELVAITDASGRKLTFHYTERHKVDYIEDPAGRRISYEYDTSDNLIKVTDPLGNSITYTYYDHTRNMKIWTDKEGHIYENTYYYNDRIATQKDPLGNITTYDYTWDQSTVTNKRGELFVYTFDEKNRLKWTKDPYDKYEGIAWDENNNKIGVTDKLGNTTNFEYDAKGNQTKVIRRGKDGLEDITSAVEYEPTFNQPTKITDGLGNITEFTYDLKGNLLKTVRYLSPANKVETEITYDQYGNATSTKDASGNSTTYAYDSYGNILITTDALNNKTLFTYDNLSRLLTKTDPRNNTTTYTYDDNNNVLTVTNAKGHKVANTYDKDGRLLTTKDPNNQVTTYKYDGLGNVIKTIDTLGNFSISEYDCANFIRFNQANLTRATDAGGHSTTYEYDKLGRLIKVTDPLGNQTKTQYDEVGNVVSTTDANGNSTTYTYDCFYRKTAVIDPLLRRTQFFYDKMGNIIKAIDAKGNSTGYEYDALYRRIAVYDAQNNITTYGYDKLGNLIWTRDPKGNTTSMQYDKLSRKTAMTDPDMGSWAYQYDANSNLTKQTDAKAQVLEFAYDALNRLTTKKANSQVIVTYTYDDPLVSYSKGRLTKVVDKNCTTEFFYDELGRQKETKKTIGGVLYIVKREYDKEGNLSKLIYPDNEAVTYTYDEADNIKKVSGNSTYVSDVQYTKTNQISGIDYGNAAKTGYSYYEDNRLKTIKTTKDSTVLQDLLYAFDAAGNISSIKDAAHTNSQTFKYDELNRLIEAEGSYGKRYYGYDAIGNMVLKDFVNYFYGQSAKFTPRSLGEGGPHAVTSGSDGTTCEYDANGNMSRKNEQLYEYDVENRLIKVTRKVTNLATASTHLNQGWNFLSIPVKPDDNKISSILKGSTAGTDYDQIARFNPISQKFQHYVDDKQFSQFDKLEFGMGYQVYVNNPNGIDITVSGKTPDRKFSLFPGWNQIGATSTQSQTQALFLANLQDGVDVNNLSWYNPLTSQYQSPSSIDPSNAYFINGLKQAQWFIQQQNAQLETLAQYFYDGDGGRVKKVTPKATTTYLGSLFEIETRIDTNNNRITTNKNHIFMGPNRICSVTKDDGRGTIDESYYHSDHLGSSNVITNSAGNLIGNYEYLPYGEFSPAINYTPSTINHFFTGKELDDETGLIFFGARYYDPSLGRWTQPDTIIPQPFNLQSFNRYSYCYNNPINLTDPTGHKPKWKRWIGKIVGAIVGAVTFVATGGNFPLAMAAFSFVSTTIDTYNMGYSVGQAIGIGIVSGTAAYIGGQIGGAFGSWVGEGTSASASALGSAIFGGAAAGAAGAATYAGLTGQDPGRAAMQGAIIGAAMGLVMHGLTYRGPPKPQPTDPDKPLPQAKSSDEAMRSATRLPQQPVETGIAAQLEADLIPKPGTSEFFEGERYTKARYITEEMYKSTRRDLSPWDPPDSNNPRGIESLEDIFYLWAVERGWLW